MRGRRGGYERSCCLRVDSCIFNMNSETLVLDKASRASSSAVPALHSRHASFRSLAVSCSAGAQLLSFRFEGQTGQSSGKPSSCDNHNSYCIMMHGGFERIMRLDEVNNAADETSVRSAWGKWSKSRKVELAMKACEPACTRRQHAVVETCPI